MKFVLPLLSPCMSSLDVVSLNLRWKDKQIRFLEPLTCPTDLIPCPIFPGCAPGIAIKCRPLSINVFHCQTGQLASVLVNQVDLHDRSRGCWQKKPCWEQLITVLIMVFLT